MTTPDSTPPNSTTPDSTLHAISAFLAGTPWEKATRTPLLNEASVRTYFRLTPASGPSAIVMHSTKPDTEVEPFARMAHLLAHLGMSVPTVYKDAAQNGLLLLEDFGNQSFLSLFKAGQDPLPSYLLLADTLATLRKNFATIKPDMTGFPDFFGPELLTQIQLIPDIYVPNMAGGALSAEAKKAYLNLWRKALAPVHQMPRTLMLRDCQPANLMYLEGRDGIKACGLLDFEMGGIGPSVYDLMSALRTSRFDVPEACVAPTLARYLSHFPDDDAQQFHAAYNALGALRALGWAGTCSKLITQDHRTDFKARLPAIWARAEGCLAHPSLADLKAWHDTHIPLTARG